MGDEKDNCIYFDISRRERDSAIRYLLKAIIHCRTQEGFPSNQYTYDEDVNVYLAHLLFAISLPEYHEMSEPYLSGDSHEVMKWINDAEDQTLCYFIFKVNADHILIHSAIFNDLSKHPAGKRLFARSEKYYLELARLYYEQAASYHKRIYRKRTGVGDVLDKMAYYFDSYQGLLKRVRKEYFHFLNAFRDKAFYGFVAELNDYEKDIRKRHVMDEFLDLYGKWLENKDPELEAKILGIVREIRTIDPNFKFDVIDRFHGSGGAENETKAA